jgi:putative ABC transport system ATP-binding protein
LSRGELAEVRNRTIGFVFQNFSLLRARARRKCGLHLYAGVGTRGDRGAKASLGALDRDGSITTDQLSGGQQQRARSRGPW